MSEPTAEPTTEPTAAPEATPPAAEQNTADLPPWAREALTKANREAAKYRTQLQEIKPRADQFDALEQASKTEAQRLAEAAETAKRDAEQARAEAVRYKVAATHGITADHFDLLGAGSEDEITERAEKLSALLKAQAALTATTTTPTTRPAEQLRPGATPSDSKSEEDLVYERLFGAPK